MKRFLLVLSLIVLLFNFGVQAQSTPSIAISTVSGFISACANDASTNLEEFTLSGTNLSDDITLTAPEYFEISTSPTSGFSSGLVLNETAGSVANTVIYVRASASGRIGTISGNVSITSEGAASEQVAVTGTLYILPSVNQVPNQTVNSGAVTNPVAFNQTGSNTFNWTNNSPGIGLPASGIGNIPSFTAVNGENVPVTATIQVTPYLSPIAYVPNSGNGTVSAINTTNQQVIATINVGQSPMGVAISPDGTKVYISNYTDGTISVINTSTNTVSATFPVPNGPMALALSANGAYLYVVNATATTVTVINTANNSVVTSIPVGAGPGPIIMSPDGTKAYVLNQNASTVSIINTTSNTVVSTIPAGTNPSGIAISPDGKYVCIISSYANTATIINTSTDAVLNTFSLPSIPNEGTAVNLTYSSDGRVVYVVGTSNVVYGIDPNTGQVISTIQIPQANGTQSVSITPDGNLLYVTGVSSANVIVVDLSQQKAVYAITTGAEPAPVGNFISNASGCQGLFGSFTITVNPATAATPAITATSPTGIIAACQGSASVNPQVQQFSVTGSNLNGNISVTAPANFQVSTSPTGGFASSLTLNPQNAAVSNTVIYVCSSESATAGSISGNVSLTSTGAASVNIPVLGKVSPMPSITPPINQTVLNGSTTNPIAFAGSNNTVSWVNDTPSIGLAASGTGNIASFAATNTTGNAITATITATPQLASFAYVPNKTDGTVSVINTANNTVVQTIRVGNGPTAVTISPDGTIVYIANSQNNDISVINTNTNTVVSSINLLTAPSCVAISPDGKYLYASTSLNANAVYKISTATNTVVATIPLLYIPSGVIVSGDGKWVYAVTDVYTQNPSSVAVINTATNAVSSYITVGYNAAYIAISPQGDRVYVTNYQSNTVSVISTATNAVIDTVQVGFNPNALTVSPDGSRVYVSNYSSSSVSVINTNTYNVDATIKINDAPYGESISSDGNTLYVTGIIYSQVLVINTNTNQVTAAIPVGQTPVAVGNFVLPGGNCTGPPQKFTITVNPAPAVTPSLSVSTTSGAITACAGTASADLQQFTVSGSNLTGNITVTAPANFEISTSQTSGFSGTLTLAESGGTVNTTTVYVRSAATAPTGPISGNVLIATPGTASPQVAVEGTVNALPVVNPVANQTVVNGASTGAVNFTGTANAYSWTNDSPTIGLPASGFGNIPLFKAVNSGSSPIIANLTATPVPSVFAYITDEGSNSVTVINTVTNAIVTTIAVGPYPIGVSASLDGTRVYVVNRSATSVSVINTATNTVIATIPVGANPIGVATSPDGTRVYVTNEDDGSISVINTATNQVITTVPVGQNPYGVVVSPDGSKIYVSNDIGSGTVSVVNAATNTLIATIPVGVAPGGIVVSADGSHVYVENFASNTVSEINTSTGTVIATIPVGTSPWGIALSPDGSRLYVSNQGSGNLYVINTSDNSLVATVMVGATPYGVAVTPDGESVYVANYNSNTVSVVATATNQVTTTIPVTGIPGAFGAFMSQGTNCSGLPVKFTITINPAASTTPSITSTYASGAVSACEGTPAVSPNQAQITVSGSNLTGNISISAPNNFQVSASPATGFASSLTLTPQSGTVNNTVIYISTVASAPVGNLSGNIGITSPGAQTLEIAITGTVNALPSANAVNNQTVTAGSPVTAINFSGTANNYGWTNDTPSIGLAASGSGNISSFTATNTGTSPVTATVTVTPQNVSTLYVANFGANTVSVFTAGTDQLITTIPVGIQPNELVLSTDKSRLYVVCNISVSVISTATNQVAGTVQIISDPSGIAVSPDGSTLYITDFGGGAVDVVSASTLQKTATIPVGANPGRICISPDGSTLYVANFGSANVSVINTASAGDINTISVGLSPDALALSPDGTTLYVANSQDNTITVINTSTDAVIATIPVGNSPDVVLVSPDGSTIYVANKTSGTISVISAASNAVTAAIQGLGNPSGLYFGPGNSELFVTNQSANTVSIINLSTNAVSSTIPTASQPFGVLYLNNGDCPGVPVKFTITVNPAPANTRGITVSPATGTITACQGMASASPNIQQFTVSGNGLTSGISVAAPPNFEISLSPNSGYTTSISLTETDGGVSSTTIYVRIAATAPVNGVLGNVSLTTDGFGAKQVPVAGTVTAAPTVTNPGNQTVADGASTGAINFSTSGSSVTWSNDTPAIGLPATGSGNIAPFTASNTGSAPVTATITATPVSVGAGCPGVPVNFTITVNPSTGPPLITVAGSLTPLTTVYGTPSAPANFTVLGVSLSAGIVVTAPAGFEVSLDNSNFSPIVTVGSSGAISATTVYIRLASSTPVGNYGGNIIFTSAGAPEATLAMPQSTVTPALLTVIADDKTKHYGTPNPELTASYIGFVNFDTPLQLVSGAVLATIAVTNSPVGEYPITVSGASSPNYNITFLAGTLTIVPTESALVIPNTFTPNGDGVNDTWQIQYLSLFTNCSVDIFTRWGQKVYSSIGYSEPWDGTYRGAALPVGTYYYIINLKNGISPLSGFVAIIK